GSFVLNGTKWNKRVITWNTANMAGLPISTSSGLGFSNTLNQAETALAEQAFAAWSKLSGLTFEEVSSSTQSDITLGFSNLDTANSGVIGYTADTSIGGIVQPGVNIFLEDPSQNALLNGANGELTYAGTNASLGQVLLHEIGHALGLASNSDPTSVMYYELTSTNQALNATDVSGIQSIYGVKPGTSSGNTNADQLIQAMASFAPPASGQSHLAANQPIFQAPLLASAH
ncbi:MAG TPA: matrixin family metalloprotease, partial [Burkholderiales bacterium]|nr:matrixin family metalloprotease [Burkholderiales bacterium]